MKKPTAPLNNLIVRLKKKYYDTITFRSGVTLHIDPTWQPAEFAMLEAEVVSVPHGIIERIDYDGYTCPVKEGDKILIRYDVVFSYKSQPDRDTPVYSNLLLWHNGYEMEELWLCDILKVFAIITPVGQLKMINSYVSVDLPRETIVNYSETIIASDLKKDELADGVGLVLAIGAPLKGHADTGIKQRDVVYFRKGVVQKYLIDTQPIYIIKQSHILARA